MNIYIGGFYARAVFVCVFLLACLCVVHADDPPVVISEIGAYEKSGLEWVEIYNRSSGPVDLQDWTFWEGETNHRLSLVQGESTVLAPSGFAVIVQNDAQFFEAYPSVTTTVFDSSWGTLNESGEEIGLKDEAGKFVEVFTYVEAKDFSLQRVDVDVFDYSDANWREHEDGNSVGADNKIKNEIEEEDDNDVEDGELEIEDDDQVFDTQGLFINEVFAFPDDEDQEWVELFNYTTGTVSVEGWQLFDGVGSIAELSGDVLPGAYVVVELSSNKLNNAGDTVLLHNHVGDVVDVIAYGNWDDGNLEDNVTGVSVGESLGKDDNGVFRKTTSPTRGEKNVFTEEEPIEEVDSEELTEEVSSPVVRSFAAGAVVINELVSDPTDGVVEFVELFNTTKGAIDVSGWWIEEGSESKTLLEGSVLPAGFLVIEKPKGNLNNSGDTVALFVADGTQIDSVTYGRWDDGNTADNAIVARDPYSLSRKVDGQDSDYDFFDFVLTKEVTAGKQNRILQTEVQAPSIVQETFIGDVVISEVYPNPPGSDAEGEFIELYNSGDVSVDLTDWRLGDGSKKRFRIKEGVLGPGAYMVFDRGQTGIALNNSGGEDVTLYSPDGLVVSTLSYGSAKEGESYSFSSGGVYEWSLSVTPGVINRIEAHNALPQIVIDVETTVAVGEEVLFDASDTVDPDGEIVSFIWNFGGDLVEGASPSYVFLQAGEYTVMLTVTDNNDDSVEQEIIVHVLDMLAFVGGPPEEGVVLVDQLLISEIVPNPVGPDSGEYIEVYNPLDVPVSLAGFILDDEDGGSRGHVIEDIVVGPLSYYVFEREETGLALNNTSDAVRLLDGDKQVLVEVAYDGVVEGGAYILDSVGEYYWSSEQSPGADNVFVPVLVEESRKRGSSKNTPIVDTTVLGIRDEDIGDRVRFRGVVAVAPGVLGSQYFYVVSDDGDVGVQVYSYKKDFPDLAREDVVEVVGEISISSGNTRVKTKEKGDMVVVNQVDLVEIVLYDIQEVGEAVEGGLVRVQGEVTARKGSYMYVDDGTEEIKVYFKKGTGISKKIYQLGDLVEVVGIVQQTKDGYQLLPRDNKDIVKTGVAEDAIVVQERVSQKDDAEVAEKYLTATAGGLTSILIGLALRARGAMAGTFMKRLLEGVVSVIRKRG